MPEMAKIGPNLRGRPPTSTLHPRPPPLRCGLKLGCGSKVGSQRFFHGFPETTWGAQTSCLTFFWAILGSYSPMQVPKSLDMGHFATERGSKTHFAKSDPTSFGMLKLLVFFSFFFLPTLVSSAIKADSVLRQQRPRGMYSKVSLTNGWDAGKAVLQRGRAQWGRRTCMYCTLHAGGGACHDHRGSTPRNCGVVTRSKTKIKE